MAVIDKGSYGYRGDEWVKDILGAVNQSGQINEWFHLMVETGASMRVGTAHTQHRYGCIIGPSLTLYEHFCAEVKKKEKKKQHCGTFDGFVVVKFIDQPKEVIKP